MSDEKFEKRYTAEERKRANELLEEARVNAGPRLMECLEEISTLVTELLDELDTARYHASCGEDD